MLLQAWDLQIRAENGKVLDQSGLALYQVMELLSPDAIRRMDIACRNTKQARFTSTKDDFANYHDLIIRRKSRWSSNNDTLCVLDTMDGYRRNG